MQRKDKAVELFRQQFNCSQAVFTAYRKADIMWMGSRNNEAKQDYAWISRETEVLDC